MSRHNPNLSLPAAFFSKSEKTAFMLSGEVAGVFSQLILTPARTAGPASFITAATYISGG